MDRSPTTAEVLQLLENHQLLVQSFAQLEIKRARAELMPDLVEASELEEIGLQMQEVKVALAEDRQNLAQLVNLTIEVGIQTGRLDILEEIRAEIKQHVFFGLGGQRQPWVTWWVAGPIAYLLSADQREEWIGDLREVNHQMMLAGYPKWMINLVNVGKIIRLIVSSIDIKLVDLILKLRGKV
jgi:hypothetical protein